MRSAEHVYTVTDYFDGPRAGIADVDGDLHVYRSMYLDTGEDDEDRFEVSPISRETLDLALESWAMFVRWRQAFDAGGTTIATHPALPEDRARSDYLDAILKSALAIDPERRRLFHGKFTVRAPKSADLPKGVLRPFEVTWTPVDG
ncbi:MAG: hypothetical protein ACREN6_10400 [Gemmatimonadaceae bacterium]